MSCHLFLGYFARGDFTNKIGHEIFAGGPAIKTAEDILRNFAHDDSFTNGPYLATFSRLKPLCLFLIETVHRGRNRLPKVERKAKRRRLSIRVMKKMCFRMISVQKWGLPDFSVSRIDTKSNYQTHCGPFSTQ